MNDLLIFLLNERIGEESDAVEEKGEHDDVNVTDSLDQRVRYVEERQANNAAQRHSQPLLLVKAAN